MKKAVMIVAVVLILTALLGTTAFATSPNASLSASAAGVSAGESVTVTVKLSSFSSTSLGIIPSYDTSAFELVSGQWLLTGAAMSDFSDGCAVIAYADKTDMNGNVFKFVLKAKANAKINSYTVSCEVQAEGYNTANPSCKISVACKHSYGKYTQVDGKTHTRTCSKCGAAEKKNHRYDNACDTTCNDCGYTRTTTHNYKTTWTSDGKTHWHACAVCGAKKDEAKHTPGPEATEDQAQKCTVCNKVLKEALSHKHELETAVTATDAGHGYKCTKCGEVANVEAHVYDDDADTTCNVCGYERKIEATSSTEEPSSAEEPSTPEESSQAADAPAILGGMTALQGMGIGAGGMLILCAIPYIILLAKKKKD